MSYSFDDYQGHLNDMLCEAYQQGRDDALDEVYNEAMRMNLYEGTLMELRTIIERVRNEIQG